MTDFIADLIEKPLTPELITDLHELKNQYNLITHHNPQDDYKRIDAIFIRTEKYSNEFYAELEYLSEKYGVGLYLHNKTIDTVDPLEAGILYAPVNYNTDFVQSLEKAFNVERFVDHPEYVPTWLQYMDIEHYNSRNN